MIFRIRTGILPQVGTAVGTAESRDSERNEKIQDERRYHIDIVFR